MLNNSQIIEKFEIKRGDVVYVDNPVERGAKTSCWAGSHCGIVASNSKGNLFSDVVTVVYATGGVSRADLPCNCVIRFYDFLPEPVGTILCNKKTTLSKNREKVVGRLSQVDDENFNRYKTILELYVCDIYTPYGVRTFRGKLLIKGVVELITRTRVSGFSSPSLYPLSFNTYFAHVFTCSAFSNGFARLAKFLSYFRSAINLLRIIIDGLDFLFNSFLALLCS